MESSIKELKDLVNQYEHLTDKDLKMEFDISNFILQDEDDLENKVCIVRPTIEEVIKDLRAEIEEIKSLRDSGYSENDGFNFLSYLRGTKGFKQEVEQFDAKGNTILVLHNEELYVGFPSFEDELIWIRREGDNVFDLNFTVYALGVRCPESVEEADVLLKLLERYLVYSIVSNFLR